MKKLRMTNRIATTIATTLAVVMITAGVPVRAEALNIPVSAQYSKGKFSFIVSEDPSLNLDASTPDSSETLERVFLTENDVELMSDCKDIVVVAKIAPANINEIYAVYFPPLFWVRRVQVLSLRGEFYVNEMSENNG